MFATAMKFILLLKKLKIVSKNIGMNFRIDKYVVLAMMRGIKVECKGIDLGEESIIQSADDEGCK